MVDDRYRRRDEHGYGRNQERGSYKEFYEDRDRYGGPDTPTTPPPTATKATAAAEAGAA